MSIIPSTGVLGETKFIIKSQETEYFSTNRYRFYYYQRGSGSFESKIEIPNPDNLRQISFGFNDPTVNLARTPSLNYLIFSEIQTVFNKIIIFDELKLYTTRQNYVTNTNSTISTLNEQVKNAIPALNLNMTSTDVLTSSILISQLVSDNLDLANSFNANSTGILTNSTTEILRVSPLKPIVNSNGTVLPPANILCDDLFCNYRGYCVQISSFKRDCKCLPNFGGSNCQIDLENKQTFDNLANNLISAIKDQIENNKIDKSLSIENNIFESLKIISYSVSKMNPLKTQMDDLAQMLNLLTQNSTSLQDSKIIVDNSKNILETIDNIFSTTLFISDRDKYNNLEANYKKGQVTAADINVIPIDLKKDSVNGFSEVYKNPKSRKLYFKEYMESVNIIVSKAINFAKENNKKAAMRNLQNNNLTQANDTTTNFILEVLDNKVLQLTPDQIQQYKLIYERIKTIFNSLNAALLNVNKRNPIEIYKYNDFYEYYLSTISDLNKYDFNKFFDQRRSNKLAYFDASACLKSLARRNQTVTNYDFSMIYFVFFNYYYPIFNYDSDLLSKSISLSYFIKFFDAEGKEIIVNDCSDNIIHYIPIYPNNVAFIQKYNFYPDKYYQTESRRLEGKTYMPFYITTDGAIDRKNDVETQKTLYYRDFIMNMTYYDQFLYKYISNSNNKFINTNRDGYSIAATNSTGEFALFAYYDPVTQKLPNTYFFNYNEIFFNPANFKTNYSAYILFILLGVFIISFLLLISLKSVVRKFHNYYEWSNYENILREKDNKVFGDSRAGFYGNLNKGCDLNSKGEKKLDVENLDKQSEKDDENGNNNFSTAKNKFKRVKIEDEENFKEQEEESKRNDGRIIIQDVEMIGMERINNVHQEDPEPDVNNMQNLHTAKLKITTTNQLDSVNNKNPTMINNKSKKKNTYSNILYKNKNLKDYNNIKTGEHISKCYNIFYFIGKRNIYANLFIMSSPYDPKYKTICKFAMFIFLQMLVTSLLFIYSPFEFSVNKNCIFLLLLIIKIKMLFYSN